MTAMPTSNTLARGNADGGGLHASAQDITIADLTGVAVQDMAIAELALQALKRVQPPEEKDSAMPRAKLVGLLIVFLWFLIGGIAHFAATDLEMSIMPPYIPWHRAAVLVSGVFELLGAAGILYAPTRRAALMGLFALTLAVTPCHFYMLQRPELFHVPYWVLVARLPLQVALLALIAWCAAGPNRPWRPW